MRDDGAATPARGASSNQSGTAGGFVVLLDIGMTARITSGGSGLSLQHALKNGKIHIAALYRRLDQVKGVP